MAKRKTVNKTAKPALTQIIARRGYPTAREMNEVMSYLTNLATYQPNAWTTFGRDALYPITQQKIKQRESRYPMPARNMSIEDAWNQSHSTGNYIKPLQLFGEIFTIVGVEINQSRFANRETGEYPEQAVWSLILENDPDKVVYQWSNGNANMLNLARYLIEVTAADSEFPEIEAMTLIRDIHSKYHQEKGYPFPYKFVSPTEENMELSVEQGEIARVEAENIVKMAQMGQKAATSRPLATAVQKAGTTPKMGASVKRKLDANGNPTSTF